MQDLNLYVSYSWQAEKKQPIVAAFEKACIQRGVRLIRDQRDLSYGDSIKHFMQQIGQGDHILVVLSDAYLKSEYCMYELLQIKENGQFRQRICPVTLDNAEFFDRVKRIKYVDYWDDKVRLLQKELAARPAQITSDLNKELAELAKISSNVSELMVTLSDMNALSLKEHQDSNFVAVFRRLGLIEEHVYGENQSGIYLDIEIKGVTQRFRWLEAGTFLMGSPETEAERGLDEIQHEVRLTQGFWLADTVCTQALWQAVMGKNPAHFKTSPEHPVESVSWHQVQKFLHVLSKELEGFTARLPTEAEWEYACRAGSTSAFAFGDSVTEEQVFAEREKTAEVKALAANDWGLFGMHGLVWEWCADGYGDYPTGAVVDPLGDETNDVRVLRGGAWMMPRLACRSALRGRSIGANRDFSIGFRFVMT